MFFKGLSEMDGFPLNGSGLWFFFGPWTLVLQPDVWIYWFLTGWDDKEKGFSRPMPAFGVKELLTATYSMVMDDPGRRLPGCRHYYIF